MKLKETLSKKLKKSGGFTLIEMLIVVAIIAILVAVSIPMVNASLDKARTATDNANLRSAKAVAMISTIEGKLNGGGAPIDTTGTTTYYYDISAGEIVEGTPSGDANKGQSSAYSNSFIVVTFKANDTPEVAWKP